MNCLSCGQAIPADAAFCNYCGARVVRGEGVEGEMRVPGGGQSSSELPTMNVGSSIMQMPPEHRQYITRQLSENMLYSGQLPVSSSIQNTGIPAPVTGPAPTYAAYPMYPPTPQSVPGYTSSPSFPPTFSSPTSLPYSGPISSAPLMPSAPLPSIPVAPPSVFPLSGFQRFLVSLFQEGLAGNPVLGIVLGSVVALLGGGLCTALVLAVAHGLMPGQTGEETIDRALNLVPLANSFRDAMELLIVALGAGFHYSSGSTAASSSYYSYTYYSPLHGLLLVPSIFLVIGGYVAASTDLRNSVRSTLWRGIGVAVPYTLLLLLVMSQVNGVVPALNGVIQPDNPVLSVDVPTLLLFGLLWGVCFGFIGATLKLATGQWRRMVRFFLRMSRYGQLLGMSIGALVAVCLGVGLSLLCVWCVIAYTSFSIPLLSRAVCVGTNWQSLTVWSIAQGPLHAVNVFAFSFGTPISVTIMGIGGGPSCFYASAPHTTLSIFDPGVRRTDWMYALFLLPAISLFCGGRVSAAAARSQRGGPALIQGALVAIPFTLLMIGLCLTSTISTTGVYAIGSGSSQSFTETAGADIFTMLLWSLLSGAIFGGLGGLYQASSFKMSMEGFFTALMFPLQMLASPFIIMLDRFSGRQRSTTISPGRLLLCAACMGALLMMIAAGVAGYLLMNLSQVVDFTENQRTMNILDVLIIAVPGVLLLSAAAVALTTNPDVQLLRGQSGGQTGGQMMISNIAHSPVQVQEGM